MSLTSNITARPLSKAVHDGADHLSERAQDALGMLHTQIDQAFSKMGHSVDGLAEATPGLMSAANGHLRQMASKSAAMAKGMSDAARARALVVADQTSDRIRRDPLKSVLIAAAAGATLTAVVALAYKRRQGS
jgi:ElaB/YqjD/DUF883 family membrane-anchored ribosome-binding protein